MITKNNVSKYIFFKIHRNSSAIPKDIRSTNPVGNAIQNFPWLVPAKVEIGVLVVNTN